jgi:hypothetical protein
MTAGEVVSQSLMASIGRTPALGMPVQQQTNRRAGSVRKGSTEVVTRFKLLEESGRPLRTVLRGRHGKSGAGVGGESFLTLEVGLPLWCPLKECVAVGSKQQGVAECR